MQRAILAGAVLSLLAGTVLAQGRTKPAFSDVTIDEAIEKGKQYLWSHMNADGNWGPYGGEADRYQLGPTALAVYALLEAGETVQNEKIAKAIEFLRTKMAEDVKVSDAPPDKRPRGQHTAKTYEFGIICNLLVTANRQTKTGKGGGKAEKGKYYDDLYKAAKLMWDYSNEGGYSYDVVRPQDIKKPSTGYDNSNTQYGLLAVWAAAMANMEVPKEYWFKAMRHWLDTQQQDGGWGYSGREMNSRGTMTAAGVASMFVCFDNLFTKGFLECNTQKEFEPIKKGLEWFDRNFEDNIASSGGSWAGGGYYLYGIERVGLASGYKYFGNNDWYRLGAQGALNSQGADGGWGSVVDTAFHMLFLVRGRSPVLFNKLQTSGDWMNRPRDLAMLTRWLTENQFDGKLTSWQIINPKVPVEDWHDAPILYMAGSKDPKFTPEEVQKIKQFILQGGTVFCVTECGGAEFTKGIKNLCNAMFPKYEFGPAPDGHPLYTCFTTLKDKPKFNILSNGVRAMLIHTDNDLSKSWQQQLWATEVWAFDAGRNVVMYVSDWGEGLRPRGTTLWPDPSPTAGVLTVKVARLDHGGNPDPEPMAFDRFKLLMNNFCKVKLEVDGPMPVANLAKAGVKVALMTGTADPALSASDRAALKDFIDKGGTLIIDAAGGSKKFAQGAQAMLAEMYGADALGRLAKSSAPFQLKGMEIDKFKYRRAARSRLGTDPNIRTITVNTKGVDRSAVFFSAEDLTAGLLGYSCYGLEGYDVGNASTDPGMCFRIMRNLVLYGDKGPNATTQPAAETQHAAPGAGGQLNPFVTPPAAPTPAPG
ncbi:MAG: DUF4159 domain-containing protein [Phycisphaerae bacterium]